MEVLLLCAGFGTRLRPLTDHVPKCLAPIGNIPLLAIWLDQLSKLKFVSKVYINAHYFHNQVQEFILENSFNIDIELIIEACIRGTTESIRYELSLSRCNDFFIIHADNFSLQDFELMYTAFQHKVCNDRLTGFALGFKSTDYDSCGYFRYSKESGKINHYIEKPGYPVDGIANGAVFMMTRELLAKALVASSGGDFCKDNLPSIVEHLFLFEASEIHVDIGTPVSLAQVQCHKSMIGEIGLNRSWQKRYLDKVVSTNFLSQ